MLSAGGRAAVKRDRRVARGKGEKGQRYLTKEAKALGQIFLHPGAISDIISACLQSEQHFVGCNHKAGVGLERLLGLSEEQSR